MLIDDTNHPKAMYDFRLYPKSALLSERNPKAIFSVPGRLHKAKIVVCCASEAPSDIGYVLSSGPELKHMGRGAMKELKDVRQLNEESWVLT